MLKDVPFDPSLDYLFVGEEILHSIRIWTAGYDIFTPNENIAFHEYTRSEKPKIWTDKVYTDEEAFQKVKELIGLENKKDHLKGYKYNIGAKRTLEEYYSFAGIDLKNKKVTKNFCRKDLIDDDVTLSNNNEITTESTQIEHFGNNNGGNDGNKNGIYKDINILHIIVICIIMFIAYKIYSLLFKY